MKIKIRYERLLSLLFLFPYFEGFLSSFIIYKNGAVFRIILPVLLIAALVFCLLPVRGKYYVFHHHYKLELLLPVYLTISLIFMKDRSLLSISTFLWMISSIIFAVCFVSFFIARNLDIDCLLVDCIENFTILCFLLIVRAIIVDHLFIDLSYRFNPPGGGAVIFGYTCTVFLAFTIYYFNQLKHPYIIGIILIVAIIGTMSRGAIWPAALVVIIYFLTSGKESKNKLTISIIVLSIGFILSIFVPIILIQIAPRLLETSDYSRQLTMRSVFKTLNWYSAKQRLFGLGLGNVYQYQQWLTDNKFNTDKFYNNFFVFHGNAILVHPHNVYFYFLLETGIVSVILFILPFVKYIYYSIKSKNLWMFILIAIILFINFFDSIMIVEPGVAAMLYVIISLLYYKNSQQDYY